jgi:hypothetical protein
MATATLQSLQVLKVTAASPAAQPINAHVFRDTETRITRTLNPVKSLDQPRPVSDAPGTLSKERLRAIAKKHRPPQKWYEGDEEQLF